MCFLKPNYQYSPFGQIIEQHHKGIYISNNPKVMNWMEKKGE